jgi:hypothetical protein
MNEKTFMVACKEFFGFLPGQTLSDFSAEVKKLTEQDRKEMTPGLEQNLGVKIVERK